MTTEIFSQMCLSWLCCLQPLACLALGVVIGRYGGLRSAAGYLWRGITHKE
jgi:hypothetical protein